jgi:hypothetical protein
MEGVEMPTCCDLLRLCTRYVMQSYSILRERRALEDIQRLLPEELFMTLEGALIEVSFSIAV